MKEILREIGMIARCFATISDIEFKDINLAKGQYLYLVRIFENPGITQAKVASILKLDRTTTAKSIKRLIEAGYVLKEKSPDNKKEFKLYCTNKGNELYQFLQREEEYSNKVTLEGITEKEQKQLFELLHKMRLNIEKDWINMKKGNKRRY